MDREPAIVPVPSDAAEASSRLVHPPERGAALRARQVVAVAALATGAAYLVWRIGWTGRGAQPVTFWLLLAAEAFGWLSLALYAAMAWRVPGVQRPRSSTPRTVDVLVPTYDEPLGVLHATLVGCRSIRHPHTTYVLDDGRRPEVAELARSMGAEYLTRADNSHAKAGNVNAALPRTSGELVLVLDADHVPLPEILDATVGYFDDPDVALVQTPHDFANRDSIQHSRPDRHEQSLFYEVIAPGKDRHGAAFWCGSAAVIRRAALEDVGGVLTDTIAEDFHTSIALHAAGWRTRYHRETLVQGLAPHDLDAFLLQRDRWARGNLRVFRTRQNPLTCKGLTTGQRVSYTASLLNYFSAQQRLVLLAVLTVTLVTGRLPMHATPALLLALWLPWSLLALASTLALGRGRLGPLDSSRYGLLTMAVYARAAGVLFTRKVGRFRVTPKEGVDHGGLAALRVVRPLVAVVGILAAALLARLLTLGGVLALPALEGFALWVCLVLGAYELGVMVTTLLPLVRRRQLRLEYRQPVELTGRVGTSLVRVVDLSPRGAGLVGSLDAFLGEDLVLKVAVPDAGGTTHELSLDVVVRSVRSWTDGTVRVGVEMVDPAPHERDRLVEYVAVIRGAEAAGAAVGEPDQLEQAEPARPAVGSA